MRTIQYRAVSILFGIWMSSCSAFGAVLATVNQEEITSDDVNTVLMEGVQGRLDLLSIDKQNELRHRILEGLIAQKLIYEDAQKSGIFESKEYRQEFAMAVERGKKQLAAKVWEQEQFEMIKIDPKEVKNYYDSNPNEFIDKEKIHARHILLKSKAEAQSIIGLLQGLSGEKLKKEFIAQAKSRSIGHSAYKGGDLGYFPRGQMVQTFNDAAFSLSMGAMTTTPVQSRYGYHIIYLEDRKPAKKMAFDEVKSFIEQRLKMDKFKVQMEKKMSEIRVKAKITYFR